MSSPILKSIRYDEIIVGYTNWWLKARFRSVFSSGKIVRTVSGTRRSGIESIFNLDVILKILYVYMYVLSRSQKLQIHIFIEDLIFSI